MGQLATLVTSVIDQTKTYLKTLAESQGPLQHKHAWYLHAEKLLILWCVPSIVVPGRRTTSELVTRSWTPKACWCTTGQRLACLVWSQISVRSEVLQIDEKVNTGYKHSAPQLATCGCVDTDQTSGLVWWVTTSQLWTAVCVCGGNYTILHRGF